jgi:beta-N-acetylhexosaminidase
MMGVPSTGASAADLRDLRNARAGNVYLSGNSTNGRSDVRRIVSRLKDVLTQARVRPFVGVDQEGGLVQHLQGPGFSRMPTALAQGRMSRADLRRAAHQWGKQLRAAGLNLNLAPVADTVPASIGTRNKPIGQYRREYGHTVRRVRRHATAFAEGMHNAHVQTAVKHFPGLGRATANTDDTRRVTDPTRARDPYLRPHRGVIAAGATFVMVSSAIYPHIDAHRRACFSRTVIEGLLRGDAHFSGIVVSDSLGAESVSFIPPRKRAIRFFEAGGTMVLDSALSHLPAMTKAVLSRIDRDPAFAAIIKQDVLRVLTIKAKAGMVG